MIDAWLENELIKLELVYQSGNLGALKDAVYWCRKYQSPLPEWANIAIFETFNDHGKWKKWLRQYKQDMADYEIYILKEEAREQGADWKQIYSIISMIVSNKGEEEKGRPSDDTIKTAYERVIHKMKKSPYRYYQLKTVKKRSDCQPYKKDLWDSVRNAINNSKPKGLKKQ